MSNGIIELIATTDVGPRIIWFGLIGKDNEFYEDPAQLGKTGAGEWMLYGGHRLWLAPEAKPRSYYPDNKPVGYEFDGETLRLLPDLEEMTGIQKEIRITLGTSGNGVRLTHKLTNCGLWEVEVAPWALSVMAPGGKAILPQEPYSPHPDIPDYPGQQIDRKYYLPVRNMVLWSYTRLDDPRFRFLGRYIILRQERSAIRPQKLGISCEQGWAAYARAGHLFVKKVAFQAGAAYPDRGCVFEVFTNSSMLELESLGPLSRLAPGASVAHVEDWFLFDGVSFEDTDESIDANVLPRVRESQG